MSCTPKIFISELMVNHRTTIRQNMSETKYVLYNSIAIINDFRA